jgi:hypothetical protein
MESRRGIGSILLVPTGCGLSAVPLKIILRERGGERWVARARWGGCLNGAEVQKVLDYYPLARFQMATDKKSRYMSLVENCDVGDRARLIEYRAKRDVWLRWYELDKDEPNSIQQQIFSMLFVDLAYRILVEPRRTTDEKLKIAARSGLLAHLLDQCYVANQILAIRRLLDKRNDVVSVRHLLDDIAHSRRLLTREIYVCYDGLPYDPGDWPRLPENLQAETLGIEPPGFSNFIGTRLRHESFDRLSGVSASFRARTDLVKESVFDKLKHWLETSPAEKLIALSHKFFAHAADADSRNSLEYSGIKLDDVAEVHRAIIRVERAITDQLLFISVARDVVPMPPLGLFKGLDNPYATSDVVAKMYEHWDQLTHERNKWSEGLPEEL